MDKLCKSGKDKANTHRKTDDERFRQGLSRAESLPPNRNERGDISHLLALLEDIAEGGPAVTPWRKPGNRQGIPVEYSERPVNLDNFVRTPQERRLEESLWESERELSPSHFITAHEQERKRIAAELHDGIGQYLSAIKFLLENGASEAVGGIHSHCLAKALSLIKEAIEEVRRISMDLRPSTLDHLGILATISWYCRNFQEIYAGISIDTETTIQEDDLSESMKTIIYRVIQEALTNTAKHADATLVKVFLEKSDGNILLTIKDNGQGFNFGEILARKKSKRGLGLIGMRERVEFSGGFFNIESHATNGTIVSAFWPSRKIIEKVLKLEPSPLD
ncbi:sensor histidine kinase [Methylomagnum sp.]